MERGLIFAVCRMMNRVLNVLSLVVPLLLTRPVFAAGYDKLVIWSGRYAGTGNAAVSCVEGPEALYFNPARLGGTNGTGATLNVTAIFPQFEAPVVTAGESLASKRIFLPVGSAFISQEVGNNMTVAAGLYTAGGDKSDYGDVNFGTASPAPVRALLRSTELSIGAGYLLSPEWSIGAAWRVSWLGGELFSQKGSGPTAVSSQITDLTGTNESGYRLGLSYSSSERRWGAGISIRGPVDWELADGTHQIQSLTTSPPAPVLGASSSDATLSTKLPLQVSLGAHARLHDTFLLALEYNYADYHVVRQTTLTSSSFKTLGLPDGSVTVPQGWRNAHIIRVGTEYAVSRNWPLRVGYVFSTKVTPEEHALYSLIAPGPSHVIDLGTGYSLSSRVQLNGAFEYSRASGTVSPGVTTALPGDYRSDAWTFHIGVDFRS